MNEELVVLRATIEDIEARLFPIFPIIEEISINEIPDIWASRVRKRLLRKKLDR